VIVNLARSEALILKDDFVYSSTTLESILVRSRAGTSIPADRIAPEEYRAAILLILRAGDGLDRKALTNAARSLFGFSRTGQLLEAAIRTAIEHLLAEEVVGEGSTGIKLRG
jgi:hypothetical protein